MPTVYKVPVKIAANFLRPGSAPKNLSKTSQSNRRTPPNKNQTAKNKKNTTRITDKKPVVVRNLTPNSKKSTDLPKTAILPNSYFIQQNGL